MNALVKLSTAIADATEVNVNTLALVQHQGRNGMRQHISDRRTRRRDRARRT